jgi:alkyl hydroperoxide reductase subunit AhpC
MTREELLIDKDKVIKSIKAQQKVIGDAQVQILRLEGALAYIEDNLKESDNDRQEPDRTE